jgi:hypothetical protein
MIIEEGKHLRSSQAPVPSQPRCLSLHQRRIARDRWRRRSTIDEPGGLQAAVTAAWAAPSAASVLETPRRDVSEHTSRRRPMIIDDGEHLRSKRRFHRRRRRLSLSLPKK